jgi:hypothetical protein
MAIDAKKQFLDYAGLSTLWTIITNRFADKDKTITKLEFAAENTGKDQRLVATLADGTTTKSVLLPNATEEHAGLMSADHFTAVRDLQTNIDKFAPFAGLKLGDGSSTDNEVSLTGRKATIGLEYQVDRNVDGTAKNAYIALLDPNYPAKGSWRLDGTDSTKYNAAADKTSWCVYKDTDGKALYAEWSVSGSAGPVNALGEPIVSQPISKIDVTELVKTGLLVETDVVVLTADAAPDQKGGTYLKLVFAAVGEDGKDNPQTQYINVTDLVEIYTAGEGIAITEIAGTGMNDDKQTGVINVIAATDDTLGAFRTGFEEHDKRYAVDLTAADGTDPKKGEKAFVYIPWDEHKVAVVSEGIDSVDGNKYLDAKVDVTSETLADGSTKYTHTLTVEAGDGLKLAEGLAKTAVQQVVVKDTYAEDDTQAKGTDYLVISQPESLGNKGTKVTVDLTTSAKDSLALADSAVQSVAVANFNNADRSLAGEGDDIVITPSNNAAEKGGKSYTIALGDRTKGSLNLADSAVQSLTVLGKTLSKTDPVLLAADAKKNMELGTAALVNTTDDVTLATVESLVTKADDSTEKRATVATTAAVKSYVDTTASNIKTNYEGLIQTTIEGLDSEITAAPLAAESTAQGVAAKTVFTKIVIEDGKLVDNKCVKEQLSINDIYDFRALSDDEIKTICGLIQPTPEV